MLNGLSIEIELFYAEKLKQPHEVFYKKVLRKIFAKLTGKHLCQSLFLIEVTGLRPATLLKKRL